LPILYFSLQIPKFTSTKVPEEVGRCEDDYSSHKGDKGETTYITPNIAKI
jgi:hypothetical protein